MKMSGGVFSCCVALLLALTSVSAVPKLKSINDLKKINFGKSVPKHSLVLLHWFANIVDLDSNNVIWLTFDPNRRDYGSHHYGNYEELLDPLPRGNVRYQYYTVGNLNQETSRQLPSYVLDPPDEFLGGNRDRIIIRVQEQNTGREALQMIDRVYITQHYATSEHQGTIYDLDHTYLVTTRLLRQIREFSVREEQRPLLYLRNRYGSNADESYIRQTWGNLACLGLLLFIIIEEKSSSNQQHNRKPEHNDRRPEHNDRRPEHNDRRPEHNVRRPEHNDRRPEHNVRRPEHNNRLKINNRLENNKRREIIIRVEDDIGLENDRSENTHSRCRRCRALSICCLVGGFILVILIIFFVYLFHK